MKPCDKCGIDCEQGLLVRDLSKDDKPIIRICWDCWESRKK
jgi:hypothetical protein